MVLVSVYDSKSETWTPPHPSQTKASAIREFQTLVNDGGKSMISQHPEDFSIHQVGEWFDRVPVDGSEVDPSQSSTLFTARLVPLPSFECLARGVDLVKKD